MTTAFDEAWDATGQAEGGYSNDPDDPGGETNWGITKEVARAHGYIGDMKFLSRPVARRIAKEAYWDPLLLDQVAARSRRTALEMFDTGYNQGQTWAVCFLQRGLNALNQAQKDYPDLVVDGKIGPKTIESLQQFLQKRGTQCETVLLRVLNGLQLARYVKIVEAREISEKYFYGWVWHRVVI